MPPEGAVLGQRLQSCSVLFLQYIAHMLSRMRNSWRAAENGYDRRAIEFRHSVFARGR
jgi:hypothetical protein